MAPRSDRERAFWQHAMRGVKPLPGRAAPPPPSPAAKQPVPQAKPAAAPLPGPAPLPPLTADRAAGYDRANAERLKRGRHPIEARLDLHGLTQAEAHRALTAFLRDARAAGKRCVLVITGRGSGKEHPGVGVLKSAVPRWLDEPAFRPHVLAIAAAQPRDGGSGALYVMLRRTRSG
jgi:DNA-nicking Smr family endonuclease